MLTEIHTIERRLDLFVSYMHNEIIYNMIEKYVIFSKTKYNA